MLAGIKPKAGEITLKDPWISTRHPTFEIGPPHVSVPAGRPFWWVFRSPAANESQNLWAEWQAFFFNLDLQTDEAMSFYRPLCDQLGKGSISFPLTGDMIFPWGDATNAPLMRAGVEDVGKECKLICVLLGPNASNEIVAALKDEMSLNLPGLIEIAVQREEAIVAISSYKVCATC